MPEMTVDHQEYFHFHSVIVIDGTWLQRTTATPFFFRLIVYDIL